MKKQTASAQPPPAVPDSSKPLTEEPVQTLPQTLPAVDSEPDHLTVKERTHSVSDQLEVSINDYKLYVMTLVLTHG